MKISEKKLSFDEFDNASYDDWKKAAISTLKGKDFEKSLFSHLPEDIILKPIYFPESDILEDSIPGTFPYLRGNKISPGKNWILLQKTVAESPSMMNTILKDELSKGQNSVFINLSNNYSPINGRNNIRNFNQLSEYLNGIDITKFPVFIDTGLNASEAWALFESYIKSKGYKSDEINGKLLFDPMTELAKIGNSVYSIPSLTDEYYNLSDYLNKNYPNFSSNYVDASIYSNAGASVADELAVAMTLGIEYMTKMPLSGDNLATNNFSFKFSVSSNFFLEIAKLRAARKLWAGICKKFDKNNKSKSFIISETSISNKSSLDIYVNMLRNTTELMSAILGSADAIITTQYDISSGKNSEFSRRNARNNQFVLQYESHLTDTADPAGGSYFIENLTNELMEKTWKIVQNIERNGGFIESVKNSYIQNNIIKVSRDKTIEAIKTRKKTILGTNLYPNLSEKFNVVEIIDSFSSPISENTDNDLSGTTNKDLDFSGKMNKSIESVTTLQDISSLSSIFNRDKENLSFEKLYLFREASPFEELRRISEGFLSKNSIRPQVLLLNIGSVKDYKGRNEFSGDFFSTAGIDCVDSLPASNSDDAVKEIEKSEHKYIVFCSSDEYYENIIPELSVKIKLIDKTKKLILAGNPKILSENIKESPIDNYIFLGSDVFGTLSEVLKDITGNV